MRKLILIGLMALSGAAEARGVSVHGYTKKNGTYVAPSHRSDPNGTISDNYGTKGNVNPYTGKKGTVTHKRHKK